MVGGLQKKRNKFDSKSQTVVKVRLERTKTTEPRCLLRLCSILVYFHGLA
mgnify:CR=1 FL=1